MLPTAPARWLIEYLLEKKYLSHGKVRFLDFNGKGKASNDSGYLFWVRMGRVEHLPCLGRVGPPFLDPG